MSQRLIYILPVIMALLMAAGFTYALLSTDPDAPRRTGVAADKVSPIPSFEPIPVLGDTAEAAVTPTTFQAEQEVVLVNIFASWCLPCKVEHPVLTQLTQEDGIPLYGLAWRDDPEDTQKWLDDHGDPYKQVGVDLQGNTGIAFGLNGVPETYIIDASGTIRYRHRGPVLPQQLEEFRAEITAARTPLEAAQ